MSGNYVATLVESHVKTVYKPILFGFPGILYILGEPELVDNVTIATFQTTSGTFPAAVFDVQRAGVCYEPTQGHIVV